MTGFWSGRMVLSVEDPAKYDACYSARLSPRGTLFYTIDYRTALARNVAAQDRRASRTRDTTSFAIPPPLAWHSSQKWRIERNLLLPLRFMPVACVLRCWRPRSEL